MEHLVKTDLSIVQAKRDAKVILEQLKAQQHGKSVTLDDLLARIVQIEKVLGI